MAWRKPTESDLVATLSRKEVDAFRRDFEIDPVEQLIADTVAWARGYIRSNGNVRMNPDESTLPASCISPAMDYAAIKVLKRISIEPTDIRKQARADAIKYFEDVAAGKINPESYGADDADTTGGPAIETVVSSRVRMDAARLEGL